MVQPIRPQDAGLIYQRQIAQADAAGGGAGTRRPGSAGASGGSRRADRVLLSPLAQGLGRALQAVSEQSDVREDRVAALRAQIESGAYQVNAAGIARRLADLGFGT